jgi:hypothetical protein
MRKQKIWVVVCLLSAVLYSCGGGKSKLITKDWKATELIYAGTNIKPEDLGGVYYSFKPDSNFTYTETGNTEKGKWSLDGDAKLVLKYDSDGHTVTQNIKELTTDKLVMEYEEHGMKRSTTLVPDAKSESK